MSDVLQSLKCSQCGGGPLTDNGDGTIACPFCGSTFAHPERVCPRCETVNEPDVRQCVSCGQTLQEPCVRCGALNLVARLVLPASAARRSTCSSTLPLAAPRRPPTASSALQSEHDARQGRDRARVAGAAGQDVGARAGAAGIAGQSQGGTTTTGTAPLGDCHPRHPCRYCSPSWR